MDFVVKQGCFLYFQEVNGGLRGKMPSVGFIRVKLLQCEQGTEGPDSEMFDPYVAVNVKEAVNLPGRFNC